MFRKVAAYIAILAGLLLTALSRAKECGRPKRTIFSLQISFKESNRE